MNQDLEAVCGEPTCMGDIRKYGGGWIHISMPNRATSHVARPVVEPVAPVPTLVPSEEIDAYTAWRETQGWATPSPRATWDAAFAAGRAEERKAVCVNCGCCPTCGGMPQTPAIANHEIGCGRAQLNAPRYVVTRDAAGNERLVQIGTEALEAQVSRLRDALEAIAAADLLVEDNGEAFGLYAFRRVQEVARAALADPAPFTDEGEEE